MPHITLPMADGSLEAYLAIPDITPAPGIIVAQEIFGVNHVMRNICDWLASQGYLACCPDLFWRIASGIQLTDQTQEEWDQAGQLFEQFHVDNGVEDMRHTLAHIRKHDACTGKAGSVGYCLGGKMTYLMATRTDADGNVSYYGVGLQALLHEADRIQHPTLLHIAGQDTFVSAKEQQAIKTQLADHKQVTIYSYEQQDHAFARVGGAHYDKAAATLANTRTLAFLANHLG